MLAIRPGVQISTIVDLLGHAVNELHSIRSRTDTEHLHLYLGWVSKQQRTLGMTISLRDMDRLVTTRTYWSLLNATYNSPPGPVTSEIDRRVMELNAELEALRMELNQQATRGWTTFAVVDTNVLMELHEQLESTVWHDLIQERATRSVHVLIPHVVIDELDRLKRSQGDMTLGDGRKVARRTLARQALRTLARMFARHDDIVRVDHPTEDGHSRPVQFELLMDPPGHSRLQSADAEIRDRALARSAYANRVTLVTYDLGNQFAAQLDGLEVVRLLDGEDQRAATTS